MNFLQREIQRIGRSRVARNTGWMMAGQGTGFVLQAVYFTVIARLLGPTEYGIYAGAFAFTSIAAQYSAMGTGTIFLRYVSGERKLFAVYWGNVLFVTIAVGCLLTVALHLTGRYVLNPASASIVALAAVANCVGAQLTTESCRVFQTFEKMRVTATLSLLTNLARTMAAVTMLLVLHRSTAWVWAIASTTVSVLTGVVAFVWVTIDFGWPAFETRLFFRHGAEGFGYSFASSTASVYNDIDKTMLSHYGMNFATGVYSMAYRIVDVATIPVVAARDAAMPRLFQQGRESLSSAADLSYKLLRRTFAISLVVSVAMFVCAPLIPHILGSSFTEGVAALRWLCLIPVFRSVHQMMGSALLGGGFQRYRTTAQLVTAAGNFAMNLWLIPHFGWLGAAWSSLICDATLGVMNWGALKYLINRTEAHKSSTCIEA